MRTNFKIFLSVLMVATFFVGLSGKTDAQSAGSPQMVVTWQAYGSYVPAKYADKALPNQSSRLTATLELIVNGKPVDLSGQTVYWYLNDNLTSSGAGKQYVVFSPFGTAPSFLTLEAELPSYNGNILTHDVQIPLVDPKAVIEAPHPSGQFSTNPITLQGIPYFFFTSDPGTLSYAWSVNGQTATAAENPQTLQINLGPTTPSGSSLLVALTINNSNNSMTGNDSTNVVYLKQL